MTRSIRDRLLTVVALGVVTSALSLIALVRILAFSTTQRIERAETAVLEELDTLLISAPPASGPLPSPPDLTIVGMRAGYLRGGWKDGAAASTPEDWRPHLESAAKEADTLSGVEVEVGAEKRVVRRVAVEGSTLVLAAERSKTGALAWAGFMVKPLPYLRLWQTIVVGLTIAMALLVATAFFAVTTVKRSALSLKAALVSLASDLSTPIPKPPVRELREVADGIAKLAESLAESRRVEAHLSRELAQKERLAALGRVVAGVAHEVRNPLASIKLRLDLASATARLPEVAERAIAHAADEIARLDRIVADLLVVSGREISARRDVELGPLVRARAESLSPWSSERRVQIIVKGEARAAIDLDSFTRAIDNLLRNAVEASPACGVVEVGVDSSPSGARVRVDDWGEGVPEDRATELFEPFFTTKANGTGLGLAISRSIARAHGGELTYQRSGNRTRFELSVERGTPVPETRPAEAPPDPFLEERAS